MTTTNQTTQELGDVLQPVEELSEFERSLIGKIYSAWGLRYRLVGFRRGDGPWMVETTGKELPRTVSIRAIGRTFHEVPAYRPVPGKLTVDHQNRIVTVKWYGTDSSGEYVEVQLAGSYGAHVRLPLSCIRPLTDEERRQAAEAADAAYAMSLKPRKPRK